MLPRVMFRLHPQPTVNSPKLKPFELRYFLLHEVLDLGTEYALGQRSISQFG